MRISKYENVGRDGTAEQFVEKARNIFGTDRYGWDGPRGKERALLNGAYEAFSAGHPENIQALLLNAKSIKFGKQYGSGYYSFLVASVLSEAAKKGSDLRAGIDVALEKLPAQDKQEILNFAMSRAIGNSNEPLVFALLDSGADANSEGALASATSEYSRCPPSIIKALYEHGARFEDALKVMKENDYGKESLDKLEFYRATLTGKPAAATASGDTLQELRDQVRELTEKVDLLLSLATTAANANQPEKTKPVRKTYPKAF
jgi:hypothetical protein